MEDSEDSSESSSMVPLSPLPQEENGPEIEELHHLLSEITNPQLDINTRAKSINRFHFIPSNSKLKNCEIA
jgi:hypothetical protein